jgi:hypothetical protein
VGVGGGCTICTVIELPPEPVPGSLSIPLQAERIARAKVRNNNGRILRFIVHLGLKCADKIPDPGRKLQPEYESNDGLFARSLKY